MKFIEQKTDGNSSLSAQEFNPNQDELENIVTDAGLVLNQDDKKQAGQAMARYGGGGADYFQDSGAANAYILIAVGPFVRSADYFEGMTVRFYTANANTGPATINVTNIGLVGITLSDGSPLTGNELRPGALSIATYNEDASEFRLNPVADFSSPPAIGDSVPNSVRATSLQLPAGAIISEFSNDPALGGNSATVVPTERAVKEYVDNNTPDAEDFSSPPPLGNTVPNTVRGSTLQAGNSAIINEFSVDGAMVGNSNSAVPTERAVRTFVADSVGQRAGVLHF